MAFAHLHVHSQFTLLNGVNTPKELAKAAKDRGMAALALTDGCNLYGAVELTKACKEYGLNPLVGVELWVEPRGIAVREGRLEQSGFQVVLIAEDEKIGYRNICALITRAIFDGIHYRPRIDLKLLEKHREGLFCLTGTELGAIRRGTELAREQNLERVQRLGGIFGAERLFCELSDQGLPWQPGWCEEVRGVARALGLGCVVTNDVRYVDAKEVVVLEALNAVAIGGALDDRNRARHRTDQQYLKTEEELRAIFPMDGEAIERAGQIAAQCHFKFRTNHYYFPASKPPDPEPEADTAANWAFFFDAFPPSKEFHVPDQKPEGAGSLNGYFRWYARAGLERRLERIAPERHAEYRERLEAELNMIIKMGFAAYLLIVAEFINWSKDRGIPVGPGRGSAAGSLVAWGMRITDIDPLRFALLFERFLNPERVSMPDIDVDFAQDRREEVIAHVRDKYGAPLVSQIITFGKLQAKAAIRDIARTLELTFQEADRIAKLIPTQLNITIKDALEQEPKLKELCRADPRVQRVVSMARQIEGITRQTGIHAAGVVIADQPLENLAPLYRDSPEGGPVVQYDMKSAESIGLIKFDFLGLKTLDQIRDAVAMVGRNTGQQIDMSMIAPDAKDAYALLQKGDALGVFQVESSGMRELLTRLRPTCLDDLVALVALYRPGPLSSGMVDDFIDRKWGRQEVTYTFPELEQILNTTYGTIVYQEQVMQVAQVLAGYSLGEADLLRRAMGKKDANEMAKQKGRFTGGAAKRGHDEQKAADLFDLLAKFAEYGFNKCLHGDTRIVDADTGERTTVEALFRDRRPFRIHALGEDGRLRARRVTDVVWNGRKRVYALETAQGRRILATGNHRFRVWDGWKLLENLAPGERLATAGRLPVCSGARWPEAHLILLAALLSEGNTCHPSTLYVYNRSVPYCEQVAAAAATFGQTVARVVKRNGRDIHEVHINGGSDWRSSRRRQEAGGLADRAVARCGAWHWAESLDILNKKATEKAVPDAVFSLSDENIELFLGWLWSGDGFICSESFYTPFYATSSKKLAEDVSMLLLRIGICSGIDRKLFAYRGAHREGFTVHLVGNGAADTFVSRLLPHIVGRDAQGDLLRRYRSSVAVGRSSKDTVPAAVRILVNEERQRCGLSWSQLERQSGLSMREFCGAGSAHKRGFQRRTIASLAEHLSSARLEVLAQQEVFWDDVVSLTDAGFADTYDLTVEEDHNFVAEGLIVHNSHSAAYGYISYQTAWMKAHHRGEHMASMMTMDAGDTDKLVVYMGDCRKAGLKILPPDLNRSIEGFEVPPEDRRAIRYGFCGIKGMGEAAIHTIIEAREKEPFKDFLDFLQRLDTRKVNRKVLEVLIKSGAMDGFGFTRARLMGSLDDAMAAAAAEAERRASGQMGLFGGGSRPQLRMPEVGEWPLAERLRYEKEALGLFLSGHPVEEYLLDADRMRVTPSERLATLAAEKEVSLLGMISTLKVIKTKKGDKMAFAQLEDMSGSVEAVFFPEAFARAQAVLASDQPVVVRGKMDRKTEENKGGGLKILADSAEPAEAVRERTSSRVCLRLPIHCISRERVDKLKELLPKHSGKCELRLIVEETGRFRAPLRVPEALRVAATRGLKNELRALFSDDAEVVFE